MTTLLLSELAVGFAEKMADTFEAGRVEELDAYDVSPYLAICGFLRNLFGQVRQSIEAELAHGVNARAFASKHEPLLRKLQDTLSTAERVVAKARTGSLSAPKEEFVSHFRDVMDDMLVLRQLLAETVAKAKLPARPIDWERVREAEAAYAKGETKPF